jgi:hypothetical protein
MVERDLFLFIKPDQVDQRVDDLQATGSNRLKSSGLMNRVAEGYPFSADAGV